MVDWKGKTVDIMVRGRDAQIITDISNVFLDTDTMDDIFSKYDPSKHMFIIFPGEHENDGNNNSET